MLSAIIAILTVCLCLYLFFLWLEKSSTLWQVREISGIESTEFKESTKLPRVPSIAWKYAKFKWEYIKARNSAMNP